MFPGFDAAMGDLARLENMAKRWLLQGAQLGHKLTARARRGKPPPRPQFPLDD
jgi:hypothetical protein